jgi:hypothetical protein
MALAVLPLAAAVAVALRANDSVLLAGTMCAAAGLLLLLSPRQRQARRAPGVWRRGARVQKAAAVEKLLRERAAEKGAAARPTSPVHAAWESLAVNYALHPAPAGGPERTRGAASDAA